MFRINYYIPLAGLTMMLLACQKQTPRQKGFQVHGIDVSHYQKHIDWPLIAAQDIHFVFVKASEGQDLQDSLFSRNWTAIKQAGIRRGAYHFFRPSVPAEKQARNFLSAHSLENGDLLPVLDIEVSDGVDPRILRKGAAKWLEIVEKHYGAKPIIYSNQNFFNEYLAGHFHQHPLWIARYNTFIKPRLKKGQNWHFWQYGNRGRLKGIDGHVDFNVFNGTMEELNNFCLKNFEPVKTAPPQKIVSVDGKKASVARASASNP